MADPNVVPLTTRSSVSKSAIQQVSVWLRNLGKSLGCILSERCVKHCYLCYLVWNHSSKRYGSFTAWLNAHTSLDVRAFHSCQQLNRILCVNTRNRVYISTKLECAISGVLFFHKTFLS